MQEVLINELSLELLQFARELNLIIQKNMFLGYTVFHANCPEAIGGFMEQKGNTFYSSFLAKDSVSTDNYQQGLRFILQCYHKEKQRTISVELKKKQIQILF